MTEGGSSRHQIVIAGAGYAGLHIALRLSARVDRDDVADITLVDKNDYHQILTELPRVAAGTRSDAAVAVPLHSVLSKRVDFLQTEITGFDLHRHTLQTRDDVVPYTRLVLTLGSRPNDFQIPGLAERALFLWSVDDARRLWSTVETTVQKASETNDVDEQRCLLSVIIGGAGATGVELAAALAEELPRLAKDAGVDPVLTRVVLVEGGRTILAGSSPELIHKALGMLADLQVDVRTNALIASADETGFTLKSGERIDGTLLVWAGGIKAPDLVAGTCLPLGQSGRVKVDQYLRALDHPAVYVAGDLASVTDPETGHTLAPLAQTALEEGETVASNLLAEMDGRPLEPFRFLNKGYVVSVGGQRGVADVAGRTFGGRLAHVLKDAIEWEYRQSVKHLKGWSAI